MDKIALEFLDSLRQGRLCLHPTDTLPGLTFDPDNAEGRAALVALKGRQDQAQKPFLGLVSSLAKAQVYYAPLPDRWLRALASLWPGPLSVVWQASPTAPETMVASDGTIGLRVPELPEDAAWFRQVLEALDRPLPTTSVNRAGEAPAREFLLAGKLLADAPFSFVPNWRPSSELPATPSTVIRLHARGTYSVLRAGAMPKSRIDQMLEEAVGSLH